MTALAWFLIGFGSGFVVTIALVVWALSYHEHPQWRDYV